MIQESQKFPIAKARDLIKDLYHPSPWIYWSDFLLSAGFGWGAFIITFRVPPFSLEQVLSFLIAVLAIYRAALFLSLIHI